MDTQVREDVKQDTPSEREAKALAAQHTCSETKPESVDKDEMMAHADRYRLSRKLVVTKDVHSGYTLVYNLRWGTIRRCSTAFWRALKFENRWGGYVAWRPELKPLVKDGFLVPEGTNEQEETLQDKRRALDRGRGQQLYWSFWPTTNCNLACDYCGQEHSNQRLSREHCDLSVQLVERRIKTHAFKKLHIGWFGGEPLLGFDLMQYLTPRFFKVAKDAGIPYDSRLVTNGTLLTKDISTAVLNHMGIVLIDVTLDGPREVHDKRRCLRGGGGTYDTIIRNLTEFFKIRGSKRTTRLTVRCNVDVRNAGSIERLIDHLAALGFQEEVAHINFANVFPWGTPPGQKHMYKRTKKYAGVHLALCEYAFSKGFKCAFLPLGAGGTCQASGPDSTVNVVPGGRLYLCGEIPLVPKYRERDHYLWWDKGTLEQLSQQNEADIVFSSAWLEELAQGKWPCTKCRWFGVCPGDCPKQHRDGTGRCPQYIYDFPERMRAYSKQNMPTPEKPKDLRERAPKWTSRKLLKRLRRASVQ